MPTSRRTVDALARRAGRRAITRGTRAHIRVALAELEHLTAELLRTSPAERADAYLAALGALADDVERIVRRGQRL